MRISVVGSYGTGLTMRVPRIPGPGETIAGGQFSIGAGGKGSNQAIGAARLGAEVSLLTAIGADRFGDAARELWDVENVDASAVVTGDQPTMAGVILVEPGGENRIVIANGALEELTPDHVVSFAGVISRSQLMMVSHEIGADVVSAALRVADEHNVASLLNPAPARGLSAEDAALVGYLTPNMGEAHVLAGATGPTDPENLLDRLRSRFRGTIVITAGAEGAWFDDGATRGLIPAARPEQVVDTTGAGDAFNAACAVGIVRGWPTERFVRYGVAAGAFAVSRQEVIPGLGRPADLEPLLGDDWR